MTMKIQVFDRIVTAYDDHQAQFNAERMQLILDGLGSLDQFDAQYYVFGEDDFPQYVLAEIAENGMDVLPLTYVDDVLYQKNEYLSNASVMQLTGIFFEIVDEEEHHAHHDHHEGGCSCGHHH